VHLVLHTDPVSHRYPLDTFTMAATVARAHQLDAAPASEDDVQEAEEAALVAGLLRGHVGLLLAELRPVLERVAPDALEWGRQRAIYEGTRSAVAAPAQGAGAKAGLRALARSCEHLLALAAGQPSGGCAKPSPGRH
jgi:hypothetical protein